MMELSQPSPTKRLRLDSSVPEEAIEVDPTETFGDLCLSESQLHTEAVNIAERPARTTNEDIIEETNVSLTSGTIETLNKHSELVNVEGPSTSQNFTREICILPGSHTSIDTVPKYPSETETSAESISNYLPDISRLKSKSLVCYKCLIKSKSRNDITLRGKAKRARSRESVSEEILREPVSSVCYDCSMYLCVKCAEEHAGHLVYSRDRDDDNQSVKVSFWEQFSQRIKDEGDMKHVNILQDSFTVVDRVHLKHSDDRFKDLVVKGICILSRDKKWVITDSFNKCIKVFDDHDNTMTRCIKLSTRPYGIAEIPELSSSRSLVVVSVPWSGQQPIVIDIKTHPAQIVHTLNVHGECKDIFHCNGKIIAYCESYSPSNHFIQILDLSGLAINTIDLNNLPGVSFSKDSSFSLAVHGTSETIYVCSHDDYSIASLNISGEVLNIFELTDIYPSTICVDSYQNVYLGSGSRPDPYRIFKLAPDLTQCNVFIDGSVFNMEEIQSMTWYNDLFYFVHEVRTSLQNSVSIIRHE